MMLKLFVVLSLVCVALHADTTVLFEPSSPDIGPFPTDYLTETDSNQLTGKRVNLPFPSGCTPASQESACSDVTLLNQLDGFSVYPQLRICFSGPVNPSTIDDGLFLIPLSQFGFPIRINRVIYDNVANCVLAKPDIVLASGARYALVVTNAIRDADGKPVQPDARFTDSLVTTVADYFGEVAKIQGLVNLVTGRLVSASVFTTLSATDWIKKAQAYVNKDPLAGVVGEITITNLKDVNSITWLAQTSVYQNPADFKAAELPLNRLDGVDRIAVGTYLSPNFLAGTLTIPQVSTKTGTLQTQPYVLPIPDVPTGYAPISFHVYLPSGKKPKNGFPVAIYGHGMGDNQWVGATPYMAATLAKNGIALIGVEVFGHGFGPASMVRVTPKNAPPKFLQAPGRTIPVLDGINFSMDANGCVVLPGPVATRDCFRQTAVDMFTLVKLLSAKKGLADQLEIDNGRIMYIGQSFGSVLGTMVVANEPRIKTAVMNVAGGPVVDVARLQNPPLLAMAYLMTRNPPMPFPDVFAFRGQAPVLTNSSVVPKAFEVVEWFNMPGDPLAFASGLKNKSVLFQIAKGDEEVPNPTNSTLIRAAGGEKETWLYRADKALKIVSPSTLPSQPHRFLSQPEMYDSPARTSIAKAAQEQVAEFLSSDGNKTVDPDNFLESPFKNGDNLFEIPANLPDLP